MIKVSTTWALEGTASLEELLWAQSIGAQVNCVQETEDVGYHGRKYQIAMHSTIKIFSNSNEVDTLLQLRFADRLILLVKGTTQESQQC